MGYARRLPHTRPFQLDWLNTEVLEQADTLTKQDRYEVNPYLIEKAQLYTLAGDIRATNADILVPSDFPGFFYSAFDAICDENKR